MKKIYSLFILSIIVISCFCFAGCHKNPNTSTDLTDLNEFKIEYVNQTETAYPDRKKVLFTFTYTHEMFDYEIKHESWTSNQGDLVITCQINQSNNSEICGNVNGMYGIKYDKGDFVLAHKPNEKVYFYKEFEKGDYNVTFYLLYAAESPHILLGECSVTFTVL